MPDKFNITDDLITARGLAQKKLFQAAREVRQKYFGNVVEVRSVIEYSNICIHTCRYCGMNKNARPERYVLDTDLAYAMVKSIYAKGRRVLLMQTGENDSPVFIKQLLKFIKKIRSDFKDLSLIGCFGILPQKYYHKLLELGVDQYILKFETSNPALFKQIKPSESFRNRINNIKLLKKIGFQVGTGNICGLPGQNNKSLLTDLKLIREISPAMGSTSIFIPNNLSELKDTSPGDLNTALNFMALMRVNNPELRIPSTSSLNFENNNGIYFGLMAGANTITIHDATPPDHEKDFVIYTEKRIRPKNDLFNTIKKARLKPVNCLVRASKPAVK